MNHYNCVYMYINKINNKKYVGQTKDFNKRHREHKTKSNNKTYIDRAFNKYGEENFEIIILKENLKTQCLMDLYECYYIKKYKCLNEENYNISDGGYGGNKYAGKTEEEMLEFRHKMSEINKGKIKNEETKKKMSESKKGKLLSEEHKRKLSENHANFKGKNHPKYGKKVSDDKKKSTKVAQYDLDGNLIKIWKRIKQAEIELRIPGSNISSCCRGKLKTAGGFIWKYIDE